MDLRKIVEEIFTKEEIKFKEMDKIYIEKDELNYFLFGRNNPNKGDEYIHLKFNEDLKRIELFISLECGVAMLPVCSFRLEEDFNTSFIFLIGNIYSKKTFKKEIRKYLELLDTPDENKYDKLKIFNIGNDTSSIKNYFVEAIERCNKISNERVIKESTGFRKKEIEKIIMAFLDICEEYTNIESAIVENEGMYI